MGHVDVIFHLFLFADHLVEVSVHIAVTKYTLSIDILWAVSSLLKDALSMEVIQSPTI
jgi:hypothetical protein